MLVLLSGGAASGKSALAEEICVHLGGRLLYIATMESHGQEAQSRITKHRAMRAGKGFETAEWYHTLHTKQIPLPCKTVLLECLSNLCANEMFSQGIPAEELPQTLVRGIERLRKQAEHVVIVSNEIFSGAESYVGEMKEYLSVLAKTNRLLAKQADFVIEAVCGLPIFHKGTARGLFKRRGIQ